MHQVNMSECPPPPPIMELQNKGEGYFTGKVITTLLAKAQTFPTHRSRKQYFSIPRRILFSSHSHARVEPNILTPEQRIRSCHTRLHGKAGPSFPSFPSVRTRPRASPLRLEPHCNVNTVIVEPDAFYNLGPRYSTYILIA